MCETVDIAENFGPQPDTAIIYLRNVVTALYYTQR